MHSKLLLFVIPAILISGTASFAATYSWEDEKGTIHFTEDPGTIPRKFKKKVRKTDDVSTTSPEPVKSQSITPQAASEPKTKPSAPKEKEDSGLYDGKTFDQWKKELGDIEIAMTAIRNRTDEIAVLFKKTARREEQKKLIDEHKSLTTQFNELQVKYNEKVESARKAGLTVNIPK